MGREINKLSQFKLASYTKRGAYSDGGGLYLQVSKWGTKAWIFRYERLGKRHLMGLGPLHTVSLAEARTRARQARQLILDGKDPLDIKRDNKVAEMLSKAKEKTFEECAEEYLRVKVASMGNDTHRKQWRSTLEQYAFPLLRAVPVNQIDTPLVLRVLRPVWDRTPETASRLRGRIERILAFAGVQGYRSKDDNPARWRGHLQEMFVTNGKQKHHEALPFDQLPAFMEGLRNADSLAAKALEFTILTAARTAEVLGADWSEIDLGSKLWTIPAERMKAKQEHMVPLSDRAVEILESLPSREGKPFVGLSKMSMWRLVRGSGHTVHGFRSTFRDWAGDRTAYPHEVIEFALAHQIPDKASAAYRRYRALDKRRRLMADWARYCESTHAQNTAELIPLRA